MSACSYLERSALSAFSQRAANSRKEYPFSSRILRRFSANKSTISFLFFSIHMLRKAASWLNCHGNLLDDHPADLLSFFIIRALEIKKKRGGDLAFF